MNTVAGREDRLFLTTVRTEGDQFDVDLFLRQR
jgi:hypothetical protein